MLPLDSGAARHRSWDERKPGPVKAGTVVAAAIPPRTAAGYASGTARAGGGPAPIYHVRILSSSSCAATETSEVTLGSFRKWTAASRTWGEIAAPVLRR